MMTTVAAGFNPVTCFFQVTGLKYGSKYNYRVFAENAAGVSDPSNIIGPLLADDPHCEIDNNLLNIIKHLHDS